MIGARSISPDYGPVLTGAMIYTENLAHTPSAETFSSLWIENVADSDDEGTGDRAVIPASSASKTSIKIHSNLKSNEDANRVMSHLASGLADLIWSHTTRMPASSSLMGTTPKGSWAGWSCSANECS